MLQYVSYSPGDASEWALLKANVLETQLIVDQPTLKKYFLRYGRVIEGTHARTIPNRIRNNVWVDVTATFDFEGHFKGHKV